MTCLIGLTSVMSCPVTTRWTSRVPTTKSRRSREARPGSSGVEQGIENPRVGGSNPPPGTTRSFLQPPREIDLSEAQLCSLD